MATLSSAAGACRLDRSIRLIPDNTIGAYDGILPRVFGRNAERATILPRGEVLARSSAATRPIGPKTCLKHDARNLVAIDQILHRGDGKAAIGCPVARDGVVNEKLFSAQFDNPGRRPRGTIPKRRHASTPARRRQERAIARFGRDQDAKIIDREPCGHQDRQPPLLNVPPAPDVNEAKIEGGSQELDLRPRPATRIDPLRPRRQQSQTLETLCRSRSGRSHFSDDVVTGSG
jgi:hypothetical protein